MCIRDRARKYANEADNSRAEMKAMVDAMARISDTSNKIGNIISAIKTSYAWNLQLSDPVECEAYGYRLK